MDAQERQNGGMNGLKNKIVKFCSTITKKPSPLHGELLVPLNMQMRNMDCLYTLGYRVHLGHTVDLIFYLDSGNYVLGYFNNFFAMAVPLPGHVLGLQYAGSNAYPPQGRNNFLLVWRDFPVEMAVSPVEFQFDLCMGKVTGWLLLIYNAVVLLLLGLANGNMSYFRAVKLADSLFPSSIQDAGYTL